MKQTIIYEDLVYDFNNQLVDKLRLHGSENEALSLWVPDNDLFKSLQNLISALKETNVNNFKISFLKSDMNNQLIEKITNACENDLIINYKLEKGRVLFTIDNIQESIFKSNKLKDFQPEEFVVDVDYIYGNIYVNETPKEFSNTLGSYALKDIFNKYVTKEQNNLNNFHLSVSNNDVEIFTNFGKKDFIIINFGYQFKHGYFNKKVKAILEMVGEIGLGLPVKEFCEHIVLKVIYNFIKLNPNFTSPAIILPNNIGPEFMIVHKLIHSLYHRLIETKIDKINNINFYDNPPSEHWLKLSKAARVVELESSIRYFEIENRINQGSIVFQEISNDLDGWPIRITLSFSNEIDISQRPKVIRNLESHVRKYIENSLQIFYEESKDKSKIRRL